MTVYLKKEIKLENTGCLGWGERILNLKTFHKLFILGAILYNVIKQNMESDLIEAVSFGHTMSSSSLMNGYDYTMARINSTSAWCPSLKNNNLTDYYI